MKTKTFLLVCLLSGLALTQVSAQNDKNGNGALSYSGVWDWYWQPVYCNGVQVDNLSGTVSWHATTIHKNWIPVKTNSHYSGVVQGDWTGENFKLSETDKQNYVTGILTWHFNLKGDKGSHYIGSMTIDLINDPNGEHIIINKMVCAGGKK